MNTNLNGEKTAGATTAAQKETLINERLENNKFSEAENNKSEAVDVDVELQPLVNINGKVINGMNRKI